jgi:antirestriction protein ArdC
MLWAAALEKAYSCPLWLIHKQAAELGGQVHTGEKDLRVVYAYTFTKTGTDNQVADVAIEIPFMKGYTVFNAEQIDGLPGHFYVTVSPLNSDDPKRSILSQLGAADFEGCASPVAMDRHKTNCHTLRSLTRGN